VNGTLVTTLNAGQFYSYMGTAVGGVQRVDVVETSKPALIGHFLVGGRYGDTLYDRGLDWDDTPLPATELRGDPSFSLVIPTIQFLRQYHVATPTTGFRLHSLTLISMTSSVSTVRLNGAQIPAEYGAFSPIAGSDYSFARLQVPVGSYSLSSSTPLGVYGSGFDDDRSYAYPAGFGLVNLEEYPGGADSVPSAETGGGADSAPSVETGGGGNTTTPPTLAATGANLEWLMVAGLIPAIAGAGLLTVRRRKRSA
jgi:LPXTG-motif cell wall-anchored protein